jgi:hypothetical protein
MNLPDELKRYLIAVRESNERIVATKRRQLDPNLQDDDLPWLVTENEQMRMQLIGFQGEPNDHGEFPPGSLTTDETDTLIGRLVIHSATWDTWEDVFEAAEAMNAEIDKALKE